MFGITLVLPRKKPVMPVVEPLTAFTGTLHVLLIPHSFMHIYCLSSTLQRHRYVPARN